MGEVESAWKEVGEKFQELGYKFRDHYRKLESERAESEEATEESEQAFKKVTDELDTAFASVGNAFRDAEVKDDAKAAANSLLSAFGATFQEIGDALQRAIGRTGGEAKAEPTEETAEPAAEEPAADEPLAEEPAPEQPEESDQPPAAG
jgi:hypothetical protein